MSESPGESTDQEPITRVAVVDDDKASLLTLQRLLERDGCDVATYDDAREALERLPEDPPDVLVLDWVMPEMDGPAVLKEIRATPALQATYCILVTAHDVRGKKIAGLLLGADDYLTKPVSETALLARVRVGSRMRRLERSASLLTMAATLGHKINNPLTGVLGYLEILEEELAKGGEMNRERADNAVVQVRQSAEQIRDVVARLRDLSDPTTTNYTRGNLMLDLGGDEDGGDSEE
ncbi:MAG: response regulator [Planctomycetota bacterium]|jgi:DNA-binding response OmpR family regulator